MTTVSLVVFATPDNSAIVATGTSERDLLRQVGALMSSTKVDSSKRIGSYFTEEQVDRAFNEAKRAVSKTPMPPEPRTIYDLRLYPAGSRNPR